MTSCFVKRIYILTPAGARDGDLHFREHRYHRGRSARLLIPSSDVCMCMRRRRDRTRSEPTGPFAVFIRRRHKNWCASLTPHLGWKVSKPTTMHGRDRARRSWEAQHSTRALPFLPTEISSHVLSSSSTSSTPTSNPEKKSENPL